MKFFYRFFFFFILILFTGCGTTSVYIDVMRPAEVNLKKYEKIAIGDIEGRGSEDISDALTAALTASGHFDVLDRAHIQQIMEEHKINMSGLVDERTAVKLGELIGTSVLVFGRVQTSKYQEEIKAGEPYTDDEGKVHQLNARIGTYTLRLLLQLTNLQTGKILAAKNLVSAQSARRVADNEEPGKIDVSKLYLSCIEEVIRDFMPTVAPYQDRVRAKFLTDDDLPEMDVAINFIRVGEWDDAIEMFQKAVRKPGLPPEVRAKAYYNLGMTQTYANEHDEAIESLKEAMKLDPDKRLYMQAIKHSKAEKIRLEKLQKQL